MQILATELQLFTPELHWHIKKTYILLTYLIFTGDSMKIKLILFILFFMLIKAGEIFAQEEAVVAETKGEVETTEDTKKWYTRANERFIKSSFTHGIHIISSESPYASSNEFRYKDRNGATMDIDFVHSTGFTMGLTAMFLSADHGSYIFPVIGISGYTYAADKWCAGVKMLVTAKHLGFNINGTWWVLENMGFGFTFNMLFSSTSLFKSSRPSEGYIIMPAVSWSFKF